MFQIDILFIIVLAIASNSALVNVNIIALHISYLLQIFRIMWLMTPSCLGLKLVLNFMKAALQIF